MDEAIQFLLTLQNYDMRLYELTQNLEDLPHHILALESDIKKLEQKIAQAKTQLQNLKLETQKLETELKSSEEAVFKCKLALTKNPQEYEFLIKKIESEAIKITQMEENFLEKMFTVDSKQSEFIELEQTINSEIQKLRQEQIRQNQTTNDLENNINEVQNKILVIRGILQENHASWLEYYDKTKKAIRKMPCMVNLKNNEYCGGCHLKVSGNFHDMDRQLPFIVCESCARLILVPVTVTEEIDEMEIIV
jgi:chromosome segregation ATPase